MATPKPGFLQYVAAAFNARPIGMFVAPNWVGLAAFGILGLTNPGFWVLGAGLELGYLLTLATNTRFQRAIASKPLSAARSEWNDRIERLMGRLDADDRMRYNALAAAGLLRRCAARVRVHFFRRAGASSARCVFRAVLSSRRCASRPAAADRTAPLT